MVKIKILYKKPQLRGFKFYREASMVGLQKAIFNLLIMSRVVSMTGLSLAETSMVLSQPETAVTSDQSGTTAKDDKKH